jgi:hypothetical protein
MFTACNAEFLSRWCFWFYAPHIPEENKSFALKMHRNSCCCSERISLRFKDGLHLIFPAAWQTKEGNEMYYISFSFAHLHFYSKLSQMNKCNDRRKSKETETHSFFLL